MKERLCCPKTSFTETGGGLDLAHGLQFADPGVDSERAAGLETLSLGHLMCPGSVHLLLTAVPEVRLTGKTVIKPGAEGKLSVLFLRNVYSPPK